MLVTQSTGDTLQLLEQRGVPQKYVPTSLGGDYCYSAFDEFIRRRISLEEAMCAAPLAWNVIPKLTAAPSETKNSSERATPTDSSDFNSPLSPMTMTISTELCVPQQVRPKAVIPKRQVGTRIMRKKGTHERRREECEQLREECKQLEHQNGIIRHDNRRLEGLLAQARYMAALALTNTNRATMSSN